MILSVFASFFRPGRLGRLRTPGAVADPSYVAAGAAAMEAAEQAALLAKRTAEVQAEGLR